MSRVEISRRLAYVLRHNPASIGISLDPEGWTEIVPLVIKLDISLGELEDIVYADKKKRYTISGNKIRANQGHSLEGVMAVDLTPLPPPSLLFHGTTWKSWFKIQESGGIQKMKRHHVHLSKDRETAQAVAQRWRGQQPVILWIDSEHMYRNGHDFFLSDNEVWMTDEVPLRYIRSCEKVIK